MKTIARMSTFAGVPTLAGVSVLWLLSAGALHAQASAKAFAANPRSVAARPVPITPDDRAADRAPRVVMQEGGATVAAMHRPALLFLVVGSRPAAVALGGAKIGVQPDLVVPLGVSRGRMALPALRPPAGTTFFYQVVAIDIDADGILGETRLRTSPAYRVGANEEAPSDPLAFWSELVSTDNIPAYYTLLGHALVRSGGYRLVVERIERTKEATLVQLRLCKPRPDELVTLALETKHAMAPLGTGPGLWVAVYLAVGGAQGDQDRGQLVGLHRVE